VAIEWRVWSATENSDQEQNDEAEAWLEMVDEVEEEWWRQRIHQALLEASRKLPARLERLMRLVYGLDGQGWHNLAAIGRLWGISRERVRHCTTMRWRGCGCQPGPCKYAVCASRTAVRPTCWPDR